MNHWKFELNSGVCRSLSNECLCLVSWFFIGSPWSYSGVTLGTFFPIVGCFCWSSVNLDSSRNFDVSRNRKRLRCALCSQRMQHIQFPFLPATRFLLLISLIDQRPKNSQCLEGVCPVWLTFMTERKGKLTFDIRHRIKPGYYTKLR